MEETVPPELADRALALLLRCRGPGSRAATSRRSRVLALLERFQHSPRPPPHPEP